MNCGLLVLLGSTSRDSLGLLQLLGAVLLRSELLRLLVELGSGLRLLLWVLGIEFARAVEYEIDDVPAVGIAWGGYSIYLVCWLSYDFGKRCCS